ncbi:MAG: cell division protein FtsQ/DivIB [Candidatus Omnitrophota bacterium]|nr:cell division protein FtsQ/DivIB [Candidatus Omnitrophota bacterium]
MVKIKKQKVYPHRKKRELRPKAKRSLKEAFKFIFWAIVVAGIGVGIVMFQYMFVDSDLFNVKGLDVKFYDHKNVLRRVIFSDIEDKDVVGTNVFLVDLKDLKEKIVRSHPELRDIVVRRVLPNRLIVQARQRIPVAQVYGDKPYFIDKDGVFLAYTKDAENEEIIPMITGIRVSPFRGGFTQKEKIDSALFLIEAASENSKLSKYKIKKIDMADSRNISFFFNAADAEKVEIKIGEGEFTKRLETLSTVLEQVGRDIDRVKYIDLRFEDPIVGPR